MADNTKTNPGVGGDNISTDDLATLNGQPVSEPTKVQRVKVQYGADGDATDVSSSNPFPVTASSLPLPTGAATAAKQDAQTAELDNIASATAFTATNGATAARQDTGNSSLATIAAKDFSTETTLAALKLANHTDLAAILAKLIAAPSTEAKQDTGNTSLASIDTKTPSKGAATIANSTPVNIASDQILPVSGTFWQATQPVSIAAVVPVSDNGGSLTVDSAQLPTSLDADGGMKVHVQNFPTSTEIANDSGNPVPVNGTINVGNFPATQPVSGTVAVTGTQNSPTTASWTSATALNTAASLSVTGFNTVSVAIVATSTITGGVVTFEVSPDGTNWFAVQMARIDSFTVESTYTLVASVNRAWSTSVDGFTNFRVRLSTVIAGTATVTVIIIPQVFAIEPIVNVGQSSASLLNATVTQQPLTKGTQGANGVTTQDLKDAGRTSICLTAEVSGAATTEALATMTESRNGATTATFTSKVITSGKRLRFCSISMEVETLGSGTAPQRVYLRLRVNTAGATTASSPEQGVWCCVNNAAIVKSGAVAHYIVPDGLEFAGDGTATYGFTLTFPDWVATTATVAAKITIIAFEY